MMQYKLQLQTMKKQSLPMREYLGKIKACCDALGAASCVVSEQDQILHILSGLGPEYDAVMVAIAAREGSWTVREVASLLLSFESRIETTRGVGVNVDGSQPSANFVQAPNLRRDSTQQGRGSYTSHGRGDGGRSTNFRGRGGRGRSGNRLICQLCQKPGHATDKCWHRYDQQPAQTSIQPRQQQQGGQQHFNQNPTANVVQARGSPSPSYHAPTEFSYDGGSSSSWYPDSGATNHVTNDISNLNSSTDYLGGKSLLLGDGDGIAINHIGHSLFSSSPHPNSRTLLLKDLLHVSRITKNLLSVSQFAKDNAVFFEFHPSLCFVKDQVTKEVILRGTLEHGLYKFSLHKPTQVFPNSTSHSPAKTKAAYPSAGSPSQPLESPVVFSSSCSLDSSLELWHKRLGHCAFDVVKKALQSCNISFNQ